MEHQDDFHNMNGPIDFRADFGAVCRAFERAWENNERPDIEAFMQQVPLAGQGEAAARLILLDVKLRLAAGEKPRPQTYLERFPTHQKIIDQAFVTADTSVGDLMSVGENAGSGLADYPRQLGRYEVVSELGSGGFGVVCLARDMTLERMVALKFGLRSKFRTEAHVSSFIREARTIAQLQHPAIVTIYDVLQVDQWLGIVQQYVDDGDLRRHLKAGLLTCTRTVDICRQLASALALSHSRGFVHCDIKPANILLDKAGNPYIADFGLAVHEVNRLENGTRTGTPRYMPPEVVLGETHRIDGRADIWSLGVMMYEMLTGVPPFHGETPEELFDQILYSEPTQPRSLVPSLSRELERICLKCLSKSVLDRYRTAQQLLDDLEHWATHPDSGIATMAGSSAPALSDELEVLDLQGEPRHQGAEEVRVVPRGLQSYTDRDADFFLHLVPGPRDRDGLPESIRFWRNWVRDNDPINNSIGLLYGPSGSGKSSLVKAGLVPKLPGEVLHVYVEATSTETEDRLLRGLRKVLPSIPRGLSIQRVLEQVRDGKLLPNGKKLLLVFDQFEQWLNERAINTQQELVRALRHCDGERIRALLLIRDDFWLPANRLIHELDVELNLGRNARLIDLFDVKHAAKVLHEFGCSFGVLPRDHRRLSKVQRRFLSEAVSGLAEQDRVVSIRLAMFAEMFRGRPWTVAELNRVGGAQGVGYKFLESTFESMHANPHHRALEREARLLLEALVPVGGQLIRGRMMPIESLREACGMKNRPLEFNALLKVLDGDLRLITPVGMPSSDESTKTDGNPTTHYQLTHDFLVGSLREWLTQKKRSTRRGRAELCLEDRAESWTMKPENRHLPSAIEYLNIRVVTRSARWTEPQCRMMRSATKYYGLRFLLTVGICLLFGWGLFSYLEVRHAESLAARLMAAETSEVPEIVLKMKGVAGVQTRLENLLVDGNVTDPRQQLHLELGTWQFNITDPSRLVQKLPRFRPVETKVVAAVTMDSAELLSDAAQELRKNRDLSLAERIAVTTALAQWVPESGQWQAWGPEVAKDLVELNTYEVAAWAELLKPVSGAILPTLAATIRDSESAPIKSLDVYSILLESATEGRVHLWSALDSLPPRSDLSDSEFIRRSIHQARLAVALIKLGDRDERLWQFLRSDENLTRRSYMIEYFSLYQVDPEVLVEQIEKTDKPQIIAALLLSLGSYSDPSSLPERLFGFIEQSCLTSRDGFVRGCAEWLYQVCDQEIPKVMAVEDANWRSIRVDGHEFNEVLVEPPAGPFKMSIDRTVHLDHAFWVSTTEVPISLFRKFDSNYRLPEFDPSFATTPIGGAHPVSINFRKVAEYCNWLSEQVGLPPSEYCYAKISTTDGRAKFRLVESWQTKLGFRLPTEAEWELACQAETPKTWNFGRSGDSFVMERYVWNRENAGRELSTRPVGRLKPNRLGLFDLHGNASEYTISLESGEEQDSYILKGGEVFGFDTSAAVREVWPSDGFSNYMSFRVVRLNGFD
jgi:serine/threonine protein kinase